MGAKFDVEVKGIERRRGGPGNGEVSGEAVFVPTGGAGINAPAGRNVQEGVRARLQSVEQ